MNLALKSILRGAFRRKALEKTRHQKQQYATEANYELTTPFKLHRLQEGPSSKVTLKRDDALLYYKQMQLIRKMEASASAMYKTKLVRGFCHLYTGQEAVGVGIKASLKDGDAMITSYRCHAWGFLMTGQILEILGELTGSSAGCCRGKGGSMHMYGKNFFGGNAIVGAQIPMGVGISLAFQYQKNGHVCISLYGDGASNNGQVFEVFNIAKLLNIPAIFVCENNTYSMGTSVPRSTANPDFYKRGDNMPGMWVDGQNLLAVREAARFARDFVYKNGPIIMECQTYRYFGHSLSDPGTSYRTREEVQHVRQNRDPIGIFKDHVIQGQLCTEEELKKIEKDAKDSIEKITKQAKAAKEVALEELTWDVYANMVIKEIRGTHPLQPPLPHKSTGRGINLK